MGSTVALQTLVCMLQRLPYYLALHEGGPQPYMAGAPDQGERFGNPGITFPDEGDHLPNRTPLGDNPSWSGTGGPSVSRGAGTIKGWRRVLAMRGVFSRGGHSPPVIPWGRQCGGQPIGGALGRWYDGNPDTGDGIEQRCIRDATDLRLAVLHHVDPLWGCRATSAVPGDGGGDGGSCNTPCYGSPNLSLIIIIKGLFMHYTLKLINSESSQRDFLFKLNLHYQI
jgi:hypothetical protein